MELLFYRLAYLAMLALFVGMVKPRWVLPSHPSPAPAPSRWRVLAVYVCAAWCFSWLSTRTASNEAEAVRAAAALDSAGIVVPMSAAAERRLQRATDSLESDASIP